MAEIVTDRPADRRFELHVDGVLAGYVDYRVSGSEYALPHTRVLDQFGGRGLGTVLVVGALEQIAEQGGQVLPYCSFVPWVMRDRPDLAALVPEARRAEFGL
ncbi:hypothetical protein HMPREF0063_11183 [Aeromicrobium marinum DSM 15272]|uniref:N-acetyltransferase domain-containing protein n=1 Tax=Aeromicrobium marinum DSM 15272 TaxID=585531 RepID=E2SAX5_9ACTN|nr:GNAT family N-acetyltransferase [Aeromicrobium marinum]EFQ83521.1 hypothetical protein HMPREF0063_11183 [Aeromicrobium marinum DSM 15272]